MALKIFHSLAAITSVTNSHSKHYTELQHKTHAISVRFIYICDPVGLW